MRDGKAFVHDTGAGEPEGEEDSGEAARQTAVNGLWLRRRLSFLFPQAILKLCGTRKVEQGYRTGREDNEVQTR